MPTTTKVSYSAFPIGNIVVYKGKLHVVVDMSDDMLKWQIMNPAEGNNKLMVNFMNVCDTPYNPLTTVEHRGNKYLVSKKGTIISLTTRRIMEWPKNNGNRVAILQALSEEHRLEKEPYLLQSEQALTTAYKKSGLTLNEFLESLRDMREFIVVSNKEMDLHSVITEVRVDGCKDQVETIQLVWNKQLHSFLANVVKL